MFKTIQKLGAAMLFSASVYTAHAQMSFANKVDYGTGALPFNHAVGDLNNDGLADLVVVISGNDLIKVFLGTGAGAFGASVDYSTGSSSSPSHVAIGDLNNDGFKDLAISNSVTSNISVFTNTGTGSFGTRRNYTTGTEPLAIAIGDFNGDNKPDLVTANFSANTISVLTNTGNGTFGTKRDLTTGSGSRPRSIAVGDLTNDGKLDIAVGLQSFNAVCVFTNTGVGTFGTKVDYGVGASPFGVAIGDFNKDGLLDIVSANLNTDNISVLTNTGTGFGTKVDYSTGLPSGPRSIAIADLNGDGSPDLAVANQNTDKISIFTNTGVGFDTKIDVVTGTTPYSVAIGDFNNDGKPDLSSANAGVNSTSIILNTSVFPKPFITEWATGGASLIRFNVSTTGVVSYAWSDEDFNSGSGTFSGSEATITGLPNSSLSFSNIILSIKGANFKQIIMLNSPDKNKLKNVKQWGSIEWSSMENAFNGCAGLRITATDVPNLSGVSSLKRMFRDCSLLNGPDNIGTWNTSNITNMERMFYNASLFNQPVGEWNTSNVTNMASLFGIATAFNQSIGGWNTSNVTNMNYMFGFASRFNQSIGEWNTSKVIDMNSMFNDAIAFNQSIGGWNISKVEDMSSMFKGAQAFNQSLATWGLKLNPNANLENLLDNSGFSSLNYDATLQGFAAGTVIGSSLGAENLKYCTGKTSRDVLTASGRNWTIIDGGADATLPRIITQPLSQSSCAGLNAVFIVSTDGTNYSYAWSNGSSANETMQTNIIGSYNVTISSSCGASIISNSVTLSTLAGTQITTQPLSQIIQPSATANLSVIASGVDLTYKWSSNETVSAISSKGAGIYTVTVSGTCGSVVSEGATIVGLTLSNASITGASANGALTSATSITISGTGFSNMATVTVNGVALSGFSVSNGTMILATIPAGTLSTTGNIILVQNPNQVASANTVVMVTDVTLGVNSSLTINNLPLTIYPNPSTGLFTVKGGKSVTVYDLLGKVILSTSETSFTISNKGIFIAQVETESGVKFVKLVVE